MRHALAIAAVAVLFFVGVVLPAGADLAPPPATSTETVTTTVVSGFEGKPAHWWAKRSRSNRRTMDKRGATIERLKVRWAPTVEYAYRLAAAIYGIPVGNLRSVGHCESTHNPAAKNGPYRGVLQEGPSVFEPSPFGRLGFSVWDPVANVLAGAYTVVRDHSWRQWSCKP